MINLTKGNTLSTKKLILQVISDELVYTGDTNRKLNSDELDGLRDQLK